MGPRAEKQKNINFYQLIGKLIIRNVNKRNEHFMHNLSNLIKKFQKI